MEPTSKVAALNTRLEAELVVAQLEEAGIDAFIVADNAGGTFPMMQMVTGGYKVMVLTAVADEATEILAPTMREIDGDAPAPHCRDWKETRARLLSLHWVCERRAPFCAGHGGER